MTTKSEFISILKKRLGNNEDPTLEDDIEIEMDYVQRNILEQLPLEVHFLVSEEYSNTTTSGERRVPVPDGFIREIHGVKLWIFDSEADSDSDKWTELRKREIDGLRNRWPGSGEPKGYDLLGDYFLLFPTPDKSYDLRIYIYQKEPLPSSLGSSGENAWMENAADLFLGEVGYIIADQYILSPALAQKFDVIRNSARTRLHYHEIEREEAGRDRFMGD